MEDRTGQQLGNYRLIKLLGQGGFADVYLGKHLHLGTSSAIKILRTQLIAEESGRFLKEANTLVALEHEAIIKVKDCGIENNTPFLVIDYAPYGTLRQRHPRGSQVPLRIALSYVQQVASALQYAHTRQIVHRDIKPENMLIGANQRILLSDFGIAVVLSTSTSQHSKVAAGTALYMAPEQILGRPQPSSDQYALATILYEWLCGIPPFQGSFSELAAQHLYAPAPSCRAINSSIPPVVDQAIMRALSKAPEQRFASVQEFASVLTQTSSTTNVSTSFPSSFDDTSEQDSLIVIHPPFADASVVPSPIVDTPQSTQTPSLPPLPMQVVSPQQISSPSTKLPTIEEQKQVKRWKWKYLLGIILFLLFDGGAIYITVETSWILDHNSFWIGIIQMISPQWNQFFVLDQLYSLLLYTVIGEPLIFIF